jgi:hypothetical protein
MDRDWMYDLIMKERNFEAEESLESKFRQWQKKEISNFDYLVRGPEHILSLYRAR